MPNEIITQQTLNMETDALAKAREMVIATVDDYKAADAFSVGLLALQKAIYADFAESKKSAAAAHKAICAQEQSHLDKVQEARSLIKPKLLKWEEEERKRAEEATRISQETARKAAENRAIEEAAKAEKEGNKVQAEAILTAPLVVAPVVIAPVIPKRQTRIPAAWAVKVANPALVPDDYWLIDQAKLDGVARATKGAIKIPGCIVYDKNATNGSGTNVR